MNSNPGVSIHAYNGMKGRLVRALKEIDRIKGIDRSYTNLATFIMQHLETKDDSSVISQKIPEIPLENEEEANSQSLREIFIENMLENGREGHRNDYRDEVYDIANMIKTNSLKIYEMIKDIFCFPCERSLETKFSESYKENVSSLTDIKMMSIIVDQYRKNHCKEDEIVPAVLAVDACSFDRLFNKNKKYAFVFYLQPIHPSLPCVPLHITPHENGFANSEIVNKISLIIRELFEKHIPIIGVSTDGDPNYNESNETTFKIYENSLIEGDFDAAFNEYSMNPGIKFFGDLLHILKLARSRILTTLVSVRVDSIESSFTAADIEPILNLGPALTDITKTGKMRDCYTQQLFTIENLQKLIDAQLYGAAVYFMPFCLWSSAIFIPNLSRDSRIFLLRTAFETFWAFYVQCMEQKKIAEITTYACTTSVAVCFAQKHFLIRCLNSTMAAIYSLSVFPDIGLDRLGTHCLEQYFGNVRSMCKGFDSFENIIKNCVKTLHNMSIYKKYNLNNTTHGRLNMAGAKMFENENNEAIHICGISDLHPQMITAAFFALVGEVGLKFKELGGPLSFPPPNDPEQVTLSESLLRGSQDISQASYEQKFIACEYFEGDEITGASLDVIKEWSYQIPRTYSKGNNSKTTGPKIFLRSISLSTDKMFLEQAPQTSTKKRGRPPKKQASQIINPKTSCNLNQYQMQQIVNYEDIIFTQKLEGFQKIIDQPDDEKLMFKDDGFQNDTKNENQLEYPVPWDIISPTSQKLIEIHAQHYNPNYEIASQDSVPLCFDCLAPDSLAESFQLKANFNIKKKAYKFLSLAKPTKYDDVVREFVPNPDELLG